MAQKSYADSLNIRVRVTPDFNSKVSFFAEGLPEGVTIEFSPQEVSSSTLVVAKIETGDNLKEGIYKFSIGARAGKIVKTDMLSVEITEHLIVILGYQFPPTYTVKVGAKVTWLNKDIGFQEDPGSHTMTDTKGRFDSGLVATGQTWSYTFKEPGTYKYWCRPHPAMVGEILVLP
jgi:plastocyanin